MFNVWSVSKYSAELEWNGMNVSECQFVRPCLFQFVPAFWQWTVADVMTLWAARWKRICVCLLQVTCNPSCFLRPGMDTEVGRCKQTQVCLHPPVYRAAWSIQSVPLEKLPGRPDWKAHVKGPYLLERTFKADMLCSLFLVFGVTDRNKANLLILTHSTQNKRKLIKICVCLKKSLYNCSWQFRSIASMCRLRKWAGHTCIYSKVWDLYLQPKQFCTYPFKGVQGCQQFAKFDLLMGNSAHLPWTNIIYLLGMHSLGVRPFLFSWAWDMHVLSWC